MRLLSATGQDHCPTCGSHLHCHSEVAGFGVPDNTGVHGRLDAPPPLQVAHGVLVQVAGQDRGEAGADPTGWELQGTVCGDETREMRKKLISEAPRWPQSPSRPGILLSAQRPFCKKHDARGFQGKVKTNSDCLEHSSTQESKMCPGLLSVHDAAQASSLPLLALCR